MAAGYDGSRVGGTLNGGETGAARGAIPPGAERSLPGFQDDERLPWLDAGEDDLDRQGYDRARVWIFMLAGLAALVMIVGGGWWAVHRGGSGAQSADGSIIAAPVGPIKEAPQNPGGKTFEGTGDSSFSVSRGQNPVATLAGSEEHAAEPAAIEKPDSTAAAGGASAAIGVQVGAYSTQQAAEIAWGNFAKAYDALSGVAHRVVAGTADIGTVYHLQAVVGSAGAANALCDRLKTAGLNCEVKE